MAESCRSGRSARRKRPPRMGGALFSPARYCAVMSQGNLEKLRRLYDAWGAGDWTDTSIFDLHAVGVFPDPTPSVQHGMQAMGTYMRRFLDSWEDMRMEAEDFRQVGDSFVVRVHRIAAGKTSGI